VFRVAPCVLQATTIYTAADAAKEIDAQLDRMKSVAPAEVASSRASLEAAFDVLQQKSVMLVGERKAQWEAIYLQLQSSLQKWSDAKTPAEQNDGLNSVRKAWAAIKLQYPKEALDPFPALWSCPMHSELLKTSVGNCPICGMALEPVYVTQPWLTAEPIIRSEVIAGEPLIVGKKSELRVRLTFAADNTPVNLSDLEETHTRKIHLLIIEPTLTDYHHEHPEPLGDGEYLFSFTPALPGIYRVWADLKPVRTHVQQYSIADIPATTHAGQLSLDEPENRHAELNGYKFDLSFAKSMLQEKDTIAGNVRVTDASGEGCEKLEIVMGAFGHFVGFSDDFSTVLHMHPVGKLPADATSRGGPDLPFYFRSNKPGLVRLFTQVRIGGKDLFPRFVVRVQPLQHLPE
jgi:Heavy metal binding domain